MPNQAVKMQPAGPSYDCEARELMVTETVLLEQRFKWEKLYQWMLHLTQLDKNR